MGLRDRSLEVAKHTLGIVLLDPEAKVMFPWSPK